MSETRTNFKQLFIK